MKVLIIGNLSDAELAFGEQLLMAVASRCIDADATECTKPLNTNPSCRKCWLETIADEIEKRKDAVVPGDGFPAGDAAGAGKGGAATYSGRPASKAPAVLVDGKFFTEGEYHVR